MAGKQQLYSKDPCFKDDGWLRARVNGFYGGRGSEGIWWQPRFFWLRWFDQRVKQQSCGCGETMDGHGIGSGKSPKIMVCEEQEQRSSEAAGSDAPSKVVFSHAPPHPYRLPSNGVNICRS